MRHYHRVFSILVSAILLLTVGLTVSCSAQTEEQALKSLRELAKNDKLPPEDFVANIESRYAGRKTGALAKLLHARIKFDSGDFAGAAALLNNDTIAKLTKVGDYALWLRGRALLFAHDPEAGSVFQKLIEQYPGSIHIHDAAIGMAIADLGVAQPNTVEILKDLLQRGDPDAYIVMARGAEGAGDKENAIKYYRAAYFSAGSTPKDPKVDLIADPAGEAEGKLKFLGSDTVPADAKEAQQLAARYYSARNFAAAASSYADLVTRFPASVTSEVRLKQVTALSNLKRMPDAQSAFNAIASTAPDKEEAYYQLALGYAKTRNWQQARAVADEMKQKYPSGKLVPKAFIDLGLEARAAKNGVEEGYYLKTAVAAFPNAIEVAQAQFELAWYQHEQGNYAISSQMFVDHLAKYVDKDTTNRGKAGYWAARDSEKAGKIADACALYNAVNYRYSANWYGYLATQRLQNLKSQCRADAPVSELIAKASANLKIVTVAPETAGPKELELASRADELGSVALFDWAIDELTEAKKTANNSPKINLALAHHYRFRNDNVNALLALAKSYPDYSQMFPEEMSKEEWDVFYPLSNWTEIKYWAGQRRLDPYQVAGLIRQESVFNPRARSGANAYGLMQLILPTAQVMARKYGSQSSISVDQLYQPPVNIELGTAYMRDMFDKYGQIEIVAVADNAGPNRVPQWRATLPAEIDEFVENIPFKETRGYVQGVIRNAAQYRRLYDESGLFKSNVGTRPLRGEIDTRSAEDLRAEFPDVIVASTDSSE
jgi:soluble lytic murein transglycosylase